MDQDARLVERILAGDDDAVRTLVLDYTPHLWRRAYGLLQDRCRAEDAVQETLDKGLRCLKEYHGTGSLRGWFTSICRRHCLDELKRRRSREVIMDLHANRMHSKSSGDDDWERNAELRLLLCDAFAALEPRTVREASILVLVRGFTREEAAEIMGVPSSTVRTWVNQARRNLSKVIMQVLG